ncbi:MAG TPA: ABC transporter ATP-binding protein [Xanthobacteraceae bacterium]|jgi:NitT/TauT family transport system ATP-binding protein
MKSTAELALPPHNQASGTSRAGARPLRAVSIALDNVTKVYDSQSGDDVWALDRLDLRIEAGQFTSIVGPSGCGKSTLLLMLAGLIPVSSGTIRLNGEVVTRPHPQIAVVFQRDLLLYWRRVLDNVLLPIEIRRWGRSKFVKQAEQLLDQVGLAEFSNRFVDELSGGMRQRVAICRALVQNPGLLIMDEPFGALDALTREQMNVDLQKLWLTVGNTVVFITHSIDEAVFLSDRVLVMSQRPGRVLLDLAIDLLRPRKSSVRSDMRFVGFVDQIRRMFEASGALRGE